MIHQNFQSFGTLWGTLWEAETSPSFGCVFSMGLLEYRTSVCEDEVGGSMTDYAGAGQDEKKWFGYKANRRG